MPITTPYTMSGTAYDLDGTTALTSGWASFINVTKQKTMKGGPVPVGSNGSWELNAANAGSGYDNGDKIHIAVWDSNGRKVGWLRHTINTVIGDFTAQSVYCKSNAPQPDTIRVTCVHVSNNTGSAITADFYDNRFGNRVLQVKVPANDSRDVPYGGIGQIFYGGICVVLSDPTADGVNYSINVNEQYEQQWE